MCLIIHLLTLDYINQQTYLIMKKLLFLGLIMTGIGFTSCSKCKTCTGTFDGQEVSQEICQDTYGSKLLYDAAIKSMETGGYNCK